MPSRHEPRQAEFASVLKTMDQRDALAVGFVHQIADGFEPSGHCDLVANDQLVADVVIAEDSPRTGASIRPNERFHIFASSVRPLRTPLFVQPPYSNLVIGL